MTKKEAHGLSREPNRRDVECQGSEIVSRAGQLKISFLAFPAIVAVIAYPYFAQKFPHFSDVTASILIWLLHIVTILLNRDVIPFMTGRLVPQIYSGYCSLIFIICALYNVASAAYTLTGRYRITDGCESAHNRMMQRHQWSTKKTWLALHLIVYIVIMALAIYCTFIFLNSIAGWFQFQVNDLAGLIFVATAFGLPGCLSFLLWSIVFEYFAFDISSIFVLFRRFWG